MCSLPICRIPSLVRRRWPTSLMLPTAPLLYLIAGFSVFGMSGIDGRASARVTPDLPEAVFRMAPPAPEPLEFRRVDPTDAVAFNASIPIAYGPNPAAKAFDQRSQSAADRRSEEHTSELQSLMRISYAVFCLKKNT